jgi:hypothetical protein
LFVCRGMKLIALELKPNVGPSSKRRIVSKGMKHCLNVDSRNLRNYIMSASVPIFPTRTPIVTALGKNFVFRHGISVLTTYDGRVLWENLTN